MPDYKKLYAEAEGEKAALISRWKTDSDLLYLIKYVMRDAFNKKVSNIINVTLSIPGQFANDVISKLGSAKEQSIVESEDTNLDTTEVEDFRRAAFLSANARLKLQGKWELNPFFDFHSCIRGGAAALCVFQMRDGELMTSIMPWDIRYVNHGVGEEGLAWAGYKTTRKKDDIEAQYQEELDHFKVSVVKKAEVLDVWHTEGNEVWVAGKKILEQEHDFGFVPVVIRRVVIGSMLADTDALEHEGEGIFFLFRNVVPEINRLLSIMQTLNLLAVQRPVVEKKREGGEGSEYKDVMGLSAITVMRPDESIDPITYGDAQRSAQLAYDIMNTSIKEATAAASDLALIESPPASGVRALIAGENRDQLLSPRLGLKSQMNQGSADMFTRQVIQIGGTIELGTTGHKRKFNTSKLDGQYEGFYKYTIKSAAVDAGRASLAASFGDDLSWKTKATQIYQLEDVDGEERQRNVEKAGRLSPAVNMRRVLVSLVEAERDEEAELLSAEMGINLKQMMAGELAPPKPEPEQEPKQMLSVFGGASGRVPGGEQNQEAE